MIRIPLAAARVAANLTQEELASKMGVSRATVNAWERGRTEMKTVYLFMFCRITGFSADQIILPKKFTKSGQRKVAQ